MKRFIFGMDAANPAECAAMLRQRGIDAVVAGAFSAECADALRSEGIEMYLCFGAYSASKDQTELAVDALGLARRWFNSGCPNDPLRPRMLLDAALQRASAIPGLKGILVDGARFASFASVEGTGAFFTCFCPRCMAEMTALGLDAEAIRNVVARLMQSRKVLPDAQAAIRQWMDFREICVQRYFDQFAMQVHALRNDLLAGAFVFAPSIAAFVGQTGAACRSLDIVSPMIYRAYPHTDGPACLGHEWAGVVRAFGEDAAAFVQSAAPESPFRSEWTADHLLKNGFPPEWIGTETAVARCSLQPGQLLCPILQIEDPLLCRSVHSAAENGADAVGLFAYHQAPVPTLE